MARLEDRGQRTGAGRAVAVAVSALMALACMVVVATVASSTAASHLEEQELAAVPRTIRTQELTIKDKAFDWGEVNPETGMMRVNCSTTVARDQRFWGEVGQKYTVECPENCAHNGNHMPYGCGPYLDDSGICKAAIQQSKLGNDRGIVSFVLVEPIEEYVGCVDMPHKDPFPDPPREDGVKTKKKWHVVTSEDWKWQQWKKGVDKTTGQVTDPLRKKYREHCPIPSFCFGLRAFNISAGQMNLGIKFTDDKSYLDAGSNALLTAAATQHLTVETWVFDDNLHPDSSYVSSAVIDARDRSKSAGFNLGTHSGHFGFGLATEASKVFSYVVAPDFLVEPNKGKWTHLAGVYDGQGIKLYVNGKYCGCSGDAQSGDINWKGTTDLLMGALVAGKGTLGNSQLDETRIWSSARSHEQIVQFMSKTIPTPFPASLVAYFRWDGQKKGEATGCEETAGFSDVKLHGVGVVESHVTVDMGDESKNCKAKS